MKTLIALAALALLAGCASTQPPGRTDTEARIAEARAAEAQSFNQAMATLGSGDKVGDGPRTAALMLMFTRQQSLAQSVPVMQRGPNWADYGLRILDVALRAYGIDKGADVAIHQSDNARDVSVASYGALAEVAGQIQAPAVPQANITQTLSGSGVIGDGSYTAPTTSTATASTETTTSTVTQTDDHGVIGSYNPVDTTTYPVSAP